MLQLHDMKFNSFKQLSSHDEVWENQLNFNEFLHLQLNVVADVCSIFLSAAQILPSTAQYIGLMQPNYPLYSLNFLLFYPYTGANGLNGHQTL